MATTRFIDIRVRSRTAERNVDRLDNRMKGLGRTSDGVVSSFGNLSRVATAVGTALAVGQISRYADAWTNVNNQIAQTTTNTREALAVQEAIFQIAQSSRTEINGVADAYQRISNSVADYGFSARDTLDVVEGLTQAFISNGASAQEANSVLVQLGQGLGAGALQGEELRAVLEASLPVSRAIAREFGVQVGQLKELGAAGELVTERVFRAIQNSLPEFQSSFERANATIAQSLTVANTSLTRLVGLTNEATGASESLSAGLLSLSETINFIGDAVASGAAAEIAGVFSDQLSQIQNDIAITTQFVIGIWSDMGDQVVADTNSTTFEIGDAFLNIIPNIRNFTQIVTVELAALTDRILAYGEATVDAFNPFDDIDVDDARGALGRQITNIENARDAAISSIIDQRTIERAAQDERISEANNLIEIYVRQREERQRLLDLDSQLSAQISSSSNSEVFGFEQVQRPQRQTAATRSSDREQAQVEQFSQRLTQETEQLQFELGLRQQISAGFISQEQASELARFNEQTVQRDVAFQAELLKLGENDIARQELTAQFRENELLLEQEHEARLTEATAQGTDDRVAEAEREAELKRLTRESDINNTQSAAIAGLNILEVFGNKSFQTQKRFAIAESIINIAGGVAKALNNDYPQNLAFAAQVALQGAALISTIKSSNPNSSGGNISVSGGSTAGGGATTPTATQAPQQNRVVDVRLDDDALLTGGAVKALINNIVSSDEDVTIAITNQQNELTRTGAI